LSPVSLSFLLVVKNHSSKAFCCDSRRYRDPVNVAPATPPCYEVDSPIKLGCFRNRSTVLIRIAVGSRKARISELLPLVTCTEMQPLSSKGSDTISKRSPYMFMCRGAVKPRSLIFAQRSEQVIRFQPFSLAVRAAHFIGQLKRLVVSIKLSDLKNWSELIVS
jgi:hypothetical protein